MSDHRRRLSSLCWLVIAAVLIRAASGGGLTIGSFLYVVDHEPHASYAAGAVLFVLSAALAVGLVISPSVALARASTQGSVFAMLYGAWWVLDNHGSGVALVAAGACVLSLTAGAGYRVPGRVDGPARVATSAQPPSTPQFGEPDS